MSGPNPLAIRYGLAFGTMPVLAGIEVALNVPAIFTHIDMGAADTGSTIGDGRHGSAWFQRHGILPPIGFPIQPENIGDLPTLRPSYTVGIAHVADRI